MTTFQARLVCDSLAKLGYPKVFHPTAMKRAEQETVFHILFWLASKFDSSVKPASPTESQEVFLNRIVDVLRKNMDIDMNVESLTQPRSALMVLLKILSILTEVTSVQVTSIRPVLNLPSVSEVKSLMSKIVEAGSSLHLILSKLPEFTSLKEVDESQIQPIQRQIEGLIAFDAGETGRQLEAIAALQAEEISLKSIIKKKRAEKDRLAVRLKNLQTVRPAFLEEYAVLESEMNELHFQYVERVRNLAFLENLIDNKLKDERKEISIQKERVEALNKKAAEEDLQRGGLSARGIPTTRLDKSVTRHSEPDEIFIPEDQGTSEDSQTDSDDKPINAKHEESGDDNF